MFRQAKRPLDHADVPEGHQCFQAPSRLGAQRVVHDRPRMSLDKALMLTVRVRLWAVPR